jgi:hypothetical protein
MYEKDGEKYFVVDSHSHFWDASKENWVEGKEQFAKGWIDCFYGYHQLGPPETHWDWEHFLKVTPEDFERDMFQEGHVDYAIFQSTYLREWYANGFNTAGQNAQLLEKWGERLIVNGRFDPRDGQKGRDPECYEFLQHAQDAGVKNVHVHKGPTIWPLDKDAFDVADVDHAATDFQGLNFVVEHVGLPRIEDFCFMAVQEPNVYAGLSVVVGGLMHARPKFFAKVMGELLFWVGEDKMLFGGDYNIWTPKWQVEGLVDWQMPDDDAFTDYPRLTTASKKKILGLNAAKLYDIPVPAECQLPTSADEPMQPGEELVEDKAGAQA